MDDKTLIICAATLCVIGASLTEFLERNGFGRGVAHVATAVNEYRTPPALSLNNLSAGSAQSSSARMLLSGK